MLREALGAADDLAVSVLVHADRHHDRNVLAGAALWRSTTAVAKFTLEPVRFERDLARRRGEAAFVVAGAVSGALVVALVGSGADELVGLLVE